MPTRVQLNQISLADTNQLRDRHSSLISVNHIIDIGGSLAKGGFAPLIIHEINSNNIQAARCCSLEEKHT